MCRLFRSRRLSPVAAAALSRRLGRTSVAAWRDIGGAAAGAGLHTSAEIATFARDMTGDDTFFIVSLPTALLFAALWLVVGLFLGYCWCAARHFVRRRDRDERQQ